MLNVGKIYLYGVTMIPSTANQYGCIYPIAEQEKKRQGRFPGILITTEEEYMIDRFVPKEGYTNDDFYRSFITKLVPAKNKDWPKDLGKGAIGRYIGRVYKPHSEDEIWIYEKTIKELRKDLDETYKYYIGDFEKTWKLDESYTYRRR